MLAGAQRLTGRAALRAALRGGASGRRYRAAFSMLCSSYPTQPKQAILADIEQKIANPDCPDYQGKQAQIARITQESKPRLPRLPWKANPDCSDYLGKQAQIAQINPKQKPLCITLLHIQAPTIH